MNDNPIDLDLHRGMTAQKLTEIRRGLQEVQADQAALRKRQNEFETLMIAAPSATFQEAALKARYVLQLYATSQEGGDPRRQKVIAVVMDELAKFSE